MIICIFSDIHGNIDALNKMINAERKIADLFLFAGDIFGYFYGQKEVIDIFIGMKNLIAIKGNHEKNYISGIDVEKLVDKYGSSYCMSISDNHFRYINNLPENEGVEIDGKICLMFHGGPQDYLEQRIYPDSFIELENDCDYMICGHTHYQLLKKVGKTTIINPGSLGQPRDEKGFSYCLLDTENGNCEFKSVSVNTTCLLKQIKEIDGDKHVWEYLSKKYSRVD